MLCHLPSRRSARQGIDADQALREGAHSAHAGARIAHKQAIYALAFCDFMSAKRISHPEWPIMQAILAQGGLDPTHDRLAEVSGVSDRTISEIVSDFSSSRLLTRGHPARLGPGLGLALGLSLGGESLRGLVVDANGTVYHALEDPLLPEQLNMSPGALLPRLRRMAHRVLDLALADRSLWSSPDRQELALLGVSVGWPCPIDRAKLPVGQTLRDGEWRRRSTGGQIPPLPERVAAALGGGFTVERCHAINDVSAASVAVAFEESRARAAEADEDRWRVGLVVRVGGGLGAATMILAPHRQSRLSFIDSRLVEGTNGLAGELGHLPIGRRAVEEVSHESRDVLTAMNYDRWECSCGRKHHLETFASGRAVIRRLQESGYDIPEDGRDQLEILRSDLAQNPDEQPIAAVIDAGRLFGWALAGPILMLDPYSITVTGSLAVRDYLVDGIGRERNLWRNVIKDSVKVRPYEPRDPKLARFVVAHGAALVVIRRLVYRNFLDKQGSVPRTIKIVQADVESLADR
jgi:predicted NBD/HSP70 family sugar kinase